MIEKALQIEGWMSELELTWLARAAQTCDIIVEFGCYKGRSTRALGDNVRGVVYAVDPWDGIYFNEDNTPCGLFSPGNVSDFISNLRDLILTKKVIPYCAPSCEFTINTPVDMVFIDGDHRYTKCLKDIEIAKSILKPNGLISGHDYTHPDWPGVKRAVDEVFGDKINQVDSIWWTTL